MAQPKAFWRSVIVLYFIIGLEILIMISPAAGFFYAAFNPVLLSLAQSPATRWLTAFYLPHMVVPPDPLLAAIRLAGSVLFVLGALVFLVCAGQVYFNKFAKKGVALRGLYSYIRHPQYLGLALTGVGLSILWPRFLVVALWAIMVALYYLLARDEERRMLGQFGEGYREYIERTGMFVPKPVEEGLLKLVSSGSLARPLTVIVTLAILSLGGAFAARAYTVRALPLWTNGTVTALAILPADLPMLEHRMGAVVDIPEIKAHLEAAHGTILAYVMPTTYVMQGMIADTGGEWQLYKRHHTIAMITDWVLHPVGHLEGTSGMMQQHGTVNATASGPMANGMVRRLIFLSVGTPAATTDAASAFAINAPRAPIFMADIDMHSLVIRSIRDLPHDTGWGRVPTPSF